MELSPSDISLLVKLVLVEVGYCESHMYRKEVVDRYSRRTWDKASKVLKVHSDGKSYYFMRQDFYAWQHKENKEKFERRKKSKV